MAFWIVCSMKAIKEQIDEQPKIIKLFSVNYARDLITILWQMDIQPPDMGWLSVMKKTDPIWIL